MKYRKFIKSKKGASTIEFFILTVVALLIGSGVFLLGAAVKEGVNIGTQKVKAVNNNLRGK